MHLIRHAEDRGHTKTDWLDSRHSFSFGSFSDPNWRNFRALRVINEDYIAPKSGFGMHPHADMEILTIPLSGEIDHKDSTGGELRLKAGQCQLMSAGKGIQHSEKNNHSDEACHLLQIWLIPNEKGTPPSYHETTHTNEQITNNIMLIAAPHEGPECKEGKVLPLRLDAYIYISRVESNQTIGVSIQPGRHVWVQIASGSGTINGESLDQGDGIAVSEEPQLSITAAESAVELVLFDLA